MDKREAHMTSGETAQGIGIIGGTGWLGAAITRALLSSNFVDPNALWISNRSGRRDGFEAWPDVRFTTDNQELVAACSTVLLSVLPQDFSGVAVDARGCLVISVMAGASVEAIARYTGAERIVRALPNAAAEIELSYTPWFAAPAVTAEDREFVQSLFGTCGRADEVPVEDQIDYFSALTGPGPAFVAFYMDAMIQHAVGRGVDPEIAERAIRQLIHGAGTMLAASDLSPAQTVRVFIDYAGITAVGLNAFQDSNLSRDIGRGIDAAYQKAKAGMIGG
jgi:pyrroline-5-carboxylate reductase